MKGIFYRYQGFLKWVKHAWLVFCLGLCICLPNNTYAENIAILKSAEIEAYSEAIHAFKQSLPSSHHVVSEYDLQGDITKGQHLARSIYASHTHIVLAVGLKAALVAKREILDIPVIVCLVLDPKKYDLPTSNMVGLSLRVPFEQELKPLQTLLPQISRIGVLFDPQKTQGLKDQLEQHARAFGLTLVSQEVHSEQEVSLALKTLREGIDVLYLIPDSTVITEHSLDFLISSTLEVNIPLIGFSADLVRSGAVTGVYGNYADMGRQAASLISTLLTPEASLIVGTMVIPDVVSQAINVKSAQYLGLPLTTPVLRSFNEQY